jgi:hypothetical protein
MGLIHTSFLMSKFIEEGKEVKKWTRLLPRSQKCATTTETPVCGSSVRAYHSTSSPDTELEQITKLESHVDQ